MCASAVSCCTVRTPPAVPMPATPRNGSASVDPALDDDLDDAEDAELMSFVDNLDVDELAA